MQDIGHYNVILLGPGNLDMLPGRFVSMRSCRECLKWEDAEFLSRDEAPEIAETRKKNWYIQTAKSFSPCGLIIERGEQLIAYSQFALPNHFPGLMARPIKPNLNIPIIACFVVHPRFQKQGWGTILLDELVNQLKSKAIGSVQTFCRIDNADTLGFWASHGFEQTAILDHTCLLVKSF